VPEFALKRNDLERLLTEERVLLNDVKVLDWVEVVREVL
jgi:hypothetical protein